MTTTSGEADNDRKSSPPRGRSASARRTSGSGSTKSVSIAANSQIGASSRLEVIPVRGVPEVLPGARLGELIARAADSSGSPLRDGDVLVVTQKIVSKAEGRLVDAVTEKDFEALVLQQSRRVLRKKSGLVISETHHGYVCANAGVDRSNVASGKASLLPKDPDRSARRIRDEIRGACGVSVAVIVSDTFGRAWRRGQTDVAIGVAGMSPLLDLRGVPDRFGRILEATEVAVADELASAAELAMGKVSGVPAAIVRGFEVPSGEGSAKDLVRPWTDDLFR